MRGELQKFKMVFSVQKTIFNGFLFEVKLLFVYSDNYCVKWMTYKRTNISFWSRTF